MAKYFQRIEIVLEPEEYFHRQVALRIRVRHDGIETGITRLIDEDYFKSLFDRSLEIGIAELKRVLEGARK